MRKAFILFFALFLLNLFGVFAQKSPIKFLNNTCTINVDTTYGSRMSATHLINLKYKFVNIGEHVTFIDLQDAKNFHERLPYCITKPKDTTVLVLKLENFFKYNERPPSAFIDVPFYYEGEIYYEKIILNYTYGKSKLIEYSPLHILNDSISNFFIDDNNNDTITREFPKNIQFTFYYPVKNITDKPIWCTKEMIAWNDVSDIRGTQFIIIPSHTTYKIPIQMNMAHKYNFSREGNIIVFSEDIFEVHKITLVSDFKPKRKYKW